MSRIYAHQLGHDPVEIHGSERAWMANQCTNLFIGLFDYPADTFGRPPWQHQFFGKMNDFLTDCPDGLAKQARVNLALSTSFHPDDLLVYEGKPLNPFCLALNTVLRAGSDPFKLCARLHGQCEIHCWVDGPDRAWLAQIIQQGRKHRILRDNQGWSNLVEFLEKFDNTPVVFSYSVCEGFPNLALAREAGFDPGDDIDNYYTLSEHQKWDFGMNALRKEAQNPELHGCTRQLSPTNWNTFGFGHGLSAFDLYRIANPQ